jgi:hypothetical protein
MQTVSALQSEVASPDEVYLSVVLPVFNELENLDILHQQLKGVLSGLGRTYEIIYVDDGSTDGSSGKLQKLAEADDTVVVIQLRRNFGQTSALSAGIDYARGEVVVCQDADLQNDPEDIPLLLAKLEEGYDLVSGWRKNRQDHWLWRKTPRPWPTGLFPGWWISSCMTSAAPSRPIAGNSSTTSAFMAICTVSSRPWPCRWAPGWPRCRSTTSPASTAAPSTASTACSASPWICSPSNFWGIFFQPLAGLRGLWDGAHWA